MTRSVQNRTEAIVAIAYRAATKMTPEAWRSRWRQVTQVQTGESDGWSVRIPELPRSEYEQLDGARVDRLWNQVKEAEAAITERVESVAADVWRLEDARIEEVRRGPRDERARRWQLLRQEYDVALADVLQVPPRPLSRLARLEQRAIRWRQQAGERRLHAAHRDYLLSHAQNERRRLLEALLDGLSKRVDECLAALPDLAHRAG